MDYHGDDEVLISRRHTILEDGIGEYQVTTSHQTEPTIPELNSTPNAGLTGTSSYQLVAGDVSQGDDGLFLRTLTYKGIGRPGIEIVTFDGSCSEDSIQTHPQFTGWAGTPSAPKFSAAYWEKNDEGTDGDANASGSTFRFLGFKPVAPNKLAGVESYLVGGVVVQITTLSTNNFSTGQIPRIESPSAAGWFFSGSYLLESVSVERHGAAYRTTKRYRSGGPNGWNTSIYPIS